MTTLINNYEQILSDIAKYEGIICLQQYAECQFNGKNALQFLDLASNTRQKLKAAGSVDWDWITNDLINSASPDIAFSLKNVYLYFPGINDFTKKVISAGDQLIPTYYQTFADKRFLYFAGVTIEKLYAFWDRIGDLLCLAFGLDIQQDRVYFGSVIDKLIEKISSPHLAWLKDFKNTKYSDLNEKRKRVVHYHGLYSYFYKEWLNGISQKKDDSFWISLQKGKQDLPFFLKEHLHLTIKGFEETVLLISEKDE